MGGKRKSFLAWAGHASVPGHRYPNLSLPHDYPHESYVSYRIVTDQKKMQIPCARVVSCADLNIRDLPKPSYSSPYPLAGGEQGRRLL